MVNGHQLKKKRIISLRSKIFFVYIQGCDSALMPKTCSNGVAQEMIRALKLPVPCMFYHFGCKHTDAEDKIEKHEAECKGRNFFGNSS